MAMIDDLSRRLAAQLQSTLQDAIRQTLSEYFLGGGPVAGAKAAPVSRPKKGRRGPSSKNVREARNTRIIEVVNKMGEASIEDVAKVLGLDKRGVGSSLYYLSVAGRVKRIADDRYKAVKGK